MPAQNFTQKIDPARALAMYDDGASDSQIAKAFGITTSGVAHWRQRHGLRRAAHNDNRLSRHEIRQAKNMLSNGASKNQVASYLRISLDTVKRIRRSMQAEGQRASAVTGAMIRNAVVNDADLPRRIERAIGMSVPKDIRLEAVSELYLELLDGKLAVDQIEAAAPRFRSRAFEMNGFNYSARSIDQENEDGFSLAETLPDPNWEAPYDEVLARVFANDD